MVAALSFQLSVFTLGVRDGRVVWHVLMCK